MGVCVGRGVHVGSGVHVGTAAGTGVGLAHATRKRSRVATVAAVLRGNGALLPGMAVLVELTDILRVGIETACSADSTLALDKCVEGG